jgi:isocitrate dehydrogenase
VRIEFQPADGSEAQVLKNKTPLQPGEVIDASRMDVAALRAFYKEQVDDAKAQGVLFSLHLKATMMKVSDPIMFGHAVEVFYRDTFAKHADFVKEHGVDVTKGLGDFYAKLAACGDEALKKQVTEELEACLTDCSHVRPPLAMVDSDNGITNLHVPSDIIIDASMPAALRDSGKMWGPDGELKDTKYVIPDRTYATSYAEVVDHCREHGAFDPATMGAVANVGLMAQKAQEYGSHPNTFTAPAAGSIRVVDRSTGETLLSHEVKEGDIWRMCQTKDSPIQDWVRLAVARAKATGAPAYFWLDEKRAHDANLIEKVNAYLPEHDTEGLDLQIMAPREAMAKTLERSRAGLDTISVTGNVLRDYLTDLFPILELGTSAKMLSIVPLLAGGGLFETGAGGSAPKHVQQLEAKNHLRWDSLGEFLALAVSIEDLAEKTKNVKARVVAGCLNDAISKVLSENKSPLRKPGLLDNRGSHFYLALFWADAVAAQTQAPDLAAKFAPAAALLAANEDRILEELAVGAHAPADVGGYYKVDAAKADAVMRPSPTMNAIIDSLTAGVHLDASSTEIDIAA